MCIEATQSLLRPWDAGHSLGQPDGHVSYVGVPHGMSLNGEQLFFSHVHLHGGQHQCAVTSLT